MIFEGLHGMPMLAAVVLLGACGQLPERQDSAVQPLAAAPTARSGPEDAKRPAAAPDREPAAPAASAAPLREVPASALVTPTQLLAPAATPAQAPSAQAKSVTAARDPAATRSGRKSGKKTPRAPSASALAPPAAAPVPNAFREAARRAVAVGDLRWAIHYYRRHLATHPRDVDALVELGTIHFRSGDRERGASLLYDAARLLIEGGDRARGSRLVPLVAQGNAALADDLYLRLTLRPGR